MPDQVEVSTQQTKKLQPSEFQSTYDQAISEIEKGALKEGTSLLLSIRASGFVSGDLENTLGKVFCESGDQGSCIEHLTNAIALNRFNSTYRKDLKVAQSKVEGGLGMSLSHPSEIAFSISSYVRSSEWLSLASLLFITLVGLNLLKKITKKQSYFLGAAAFLCAVLSIFTLSASKISVLKAEQPIKASPLESADAIQTLKSGTRLRIIATSGDYVEVELSNLRGWIKNQNLAKSPY